MSLRNAGRSDAVVSRFLTLAVWLRVPSCGSVSHRIGFTWMKPVEFKKNKCIATSNKKLVETSASDYIGFFPHKFQARQVPHQSALFWCNQVQSCSIVTGGGLSSFPLTQESNLLPGYPFPPSLLTTFTRNAISDPLRNCILGSPWTSERGGVS